MHTEKKINGRDNYFKILTKASKVADKAFFEYLKKDPFGKDKLIIYEPLLSKKRGTQRLRATLTLLSYCALTEKNPFDKIDDDFAKLMISTELELWSEYMANWIFDSKGDVKNNPLVRKKVAVATKSFLEDAVRISGQVGKKYSDAILDTSSNVTRGFIKEFILDMSNNALLDIPFENYIKIYEVDYAIPGIGKTFSLGSELAALYSKKEKTLKARELNNIFLRFGTIHEILNDFGDFATGDMTNDKVSSDQFSDIQNGAMTPPIWTIYNRSNNENKKIILNCVGKDSLTLKEKDKLIKILFESGTYKFILQYLKKEGKEIKKRIKKLNFDNKSNSLLQQAMTVFESNKIYHTLKENYEEAKKRNL